jgi:hypothetical protein
MRRCLLYQACLLVFLALLGSAKPVALQTPSKSSFWDLVLRIAGVSVTPSHLKGLEAAPLRGDVWIANLAKHTRQRLTWEGTYRSPVFLQGDTAILALRNDDIVRIPTDGANAEALYRIPEVAKLVGISQDDPDKILTLRHTSQGRFALGLLSLREGKIMPLPYDHSDPKAQSMLPHLLAWDRVYGTTTVSVKSISTTAREQTDVYLQQGHATPINVSQCQDATCGQPALAQNGKQVVFIKKDVQ